MSFLSGISKEGLEDSQDRLGGRVLFNSDVYDATIKAVYGTISKSGAKAFNIIADIKGTEYRETAYITDSKGNNFFHGTQESNKDKKFPMPGFTLIDDLCLLITGYPLDSQVIEDKVFKIYDFDAKAEIPKSVPMLVNLTGKEVTLAIVKILENKSQKSESTGKYEKIADTQEINNIDKIFHYETKKTVVEFREGIDPAQFMNQWIEKNKDKIRNKVDKNVSSGISSGKPPISNSGASGSKPPTSLFKKP